MADAQELLAEAWTPLVALADGVDEAMGWTPTLLPGWTTRDLLFHLAGDAQRALVALFTPASTPTTDEIDYWREWTPGTEGAQAGLRGTRTIASQWSSVRGPAELFAETARAALRAAQRIDPASVVATQGRALTADALVRTLAIEAAIHHLDLEPVLPKRPSDSVLGEVRRVLDALLGQPAPADWDSVRWARLGTGRVQPSSSEAAALGPLVDRLPLFG